jgi:hypothetical protein
VGLSNKFTYTIGSLSKGSEGTFVQLNPYLKDQKTRLYLTLTCILVVALSVLLLVHSHSCECHVLLIFFKDLSLCSAEVSIDQYQICVWFVLF